MAQVEDYFTLSKTFKGVLNMDTAHMKPPEQRRIGQL